MLTIVDDLTLSTAKNPKHGDVQILLERLLVEVVAENYRYFLHECITIARDDDNEPEYWCWPPLLANERQVSGLFGNALSVVCPVSRPEMGIRRKRSKNEIDDEGVSSDASGRVDFYASFGTRSIALELKRVQISTVEPVGDFKGLEHEWRRVSGQAAQALSFMRKFSSDHPNSVSIGLLVIRVSRTVALRQELTSAQHISMERFSAIVDGVKAKIWPDFLAVYKAPHEMQVIKGWGSNEQKMQVIPGVIFAASVHVRDMNC